ncbi:hypothetical protein N2152v2_004369 [Parachlorella kessleri]
MDAHEMTMPRSAFSGEEHFPDIPEERESYLSRARVFELMYEDGTPANKVIKIAHADVGHNFLNKIFIGMEREWEIGVQLRAALEDDNGNLPGFVRVCDCIVEPESNTGATRAHFSGMILEKINGWESFKRLEADSFHNIHYVREMLFQASLGVAFSALDRAQRRMGFHHADLGLRNVMEHYPLLWEEVEEEDRQENVEAALEGHSRSSSQSLSANRYEVSEGAPMDATAFAPPETQAGAPTSAAFPAAHYAHNGPQQAQQGGAAAPKAASQRAPAKPCLKCGGGSSVAAAPRPKRTVVRITGGDGGSMRDALAGPGGAAGSSARDGDSSLASGPDTPTQDGSGSPVIPLEPRRAEIVHQPSIRQPSWRRPPPGGPTCPRIAPRPGYSCSEDGKRLPLGPQIEFKIIDYGIAAFDDTLAQAAGGDEAQQMLSRIQQVFAARKQVGKGRVSEAIHSMRSGKKAATTMEMVTGEEVKLPGRKKRRTWHLLPTSKANRFKVKSSAAGVEPMPSSALSSMLPDAIFSGEEGEDTPNGTSHNARSSMSGSVASGGGSQRSSSKRPPKPSKSTPRMGPVEVLYRRFWSRKGDVFHLLMSLGLILDDRVWPKQDEREVNMFVSLVHHVTGVQLKVSFANPDEVAVRCFGLSQMRRQYGKRGRWFAWLRRMNVLAQGHLRPYNSGLTAAEALTSPFFGAERVQHAKLPVCTAAAFPSSVHSDQEPRLLRDSP